MWRQARLASLCVCAGECLPRGGCWRCIFINCQTSRHNQLSGHSYSEESDHVETGHVKSKRACVRLERSLFDGRRLVAMHSQIDYLL